MLTSLRHANLLRGGNDREGLADDSVLTGTTMSGDPMQDVLPEGGLIRKLWVGEAAKYRGHMLRLDPESRNSRFAGGVSDDFIRKYADLSQSLDAMIHGFFIGGMMRGAAELRPLGVRFPRQAGAAISVEKPGQSHGGGSALLRHTLLTACHRGL